jgi:hypothetical protein
LLAGDAQQAARTRLHESPLTEITARITLPRSLLALPAAVEEPVIPTLGAGAAQEPLSILTLRSSSNGRADLVSKAQIAVLGRCQRRRRGLSRRGPATAW